MILVIMITPTPMLRRRPDRAPNIWKQGFKEFFAATCPGRAVDFKDLAHQEHELADHVRLEVLRLWWARSATNRACCPTHTCCTAAYPEAAHQDKEQCLQRLISHRVMLQTTSRNPVDWLHTKSREPSSTSQRGRGHICDEPNTQLHGSTQTHILLASSNKEAVPQRV